MSQQTAAQAADEKELPDYLIYASNALYAVAGALFIGGLWADWKATGQTFIPWLAIADEPTANSGLFLLAIIILAIGYLLAKVGLYIQARRVEEVDETQEWTVDVSK